jgi:hypothetical protein
MLELYILIAIIIGLCGAIYYYSDDEPFENESKAGSESFTLRACPSGYNSFNDSDGSTLCCNGEILANTCNGDKQCTLGTGGPIPTCVSFLQAEYKKKGEQCPISMPLYYENAEAKAKGCTVGSYNSTMDGPATTKQPVCKIYPVLDDNINALDSCYNQKEMDEFKCFGGNCHKTLVQNKPATPVLVTVTFTDLTGIQRTAHTRASMKRYLDVTNPTWKDKGVMDLAKNISIAEVAKAYYIDKTIQQSDIQL